MNKQELAKAMATRLQSTQTEAERWVDALIDELQAGLLRDGQVMLRDFGTLESVWRAARIGYNAQARQPISIQAHASARFKPGKALKAALNGGAKG